MTGPRGTQPRVRLSAPNDILATIPFLVGYHPSDSVVVLGMTEHRVSFTARDDLPPAGEQPPEEQVSYLVEIVMRQGCGRVMLVGYGGEERVTPTITALLDSFEHAGAKVVDALRADRGRYWSYLCANPRCCPPQGMPYDTSSSEVAAVWTLSGRVARRDRSEYEEQIRPVIGPAREAMHRATAAAHERLIGLIADAEDEEQAEAALLNAGNLAIAEALDRQLSGQAPAEAQAAWLSVLLQSVAIRDIAWSLIRGSGMALFHHRALWQEVLHRAENDLVPAPACLFAFAAWRGGDGGIARLALERALDVDPRYRMAILLHEAITLGLPPTALESWPENADAVIRRGRGGRRRRRSSKSHAGTPPA
jgi:Domain of unknown function (DUF4192)